MGAIQWNLSDSALQVYKSVCALAGTQTQEEFIAAVAAFNELPAEERGKDLYDHSRNLTENVDRSMSTTTPSGYPLTIKMAKNGTLSLETSLRT